MTKSDALKNFGSLSLNCWEALNFQTSCHNLKIRGLGEKCVWLFYYFIIIIIIIWEELWLFKAKESMLLFGQKHKTLMKTTISHISYWDQLIFWKNFWKFWNGPPCRNKSKPSPQLNVALYWQSKKGSNTEACAKKLSQILAKNIDNEREGDWSQNLC